VRREIIDDGAEKEQRAFDISIGVLRLLLAHRSCHLLGHRGTNRDEKVAPITCSQNQVSAEQTGLPQRLVACLLLTIWTVFLLDYVTRANIYTGYATT